MSGAISRVKRSTGACSTLLTATRSSTSGRSSGGGPASRPWVASVGAQNAVPAELNGATTLHVRVTDADAAEAQLLRLILDDPHTTVIEFGRTKQNLEAIFLQMVEGGDKMTR